MNQRFTLAALVVTLLFPALTDAQQQQFQVTVDTGNVRQGPSTTTRILGRVHRDDLLTVVRELDGWLEVELSNNGRLIRGHVHRSLGMIRRLAVIMPVPSTAQPAVESAPLGQVQAHKRSVVSESVLTAPATGADVPPVGTTSQAKDGLALGARTGGLGMALSVRFWQTDRIGLELQLSRLSVGYEGGAYGIVGETRMTVTQFAPGVIYRFGEADSDDEGLRIRPYVGGGLNVLRASESFTLSGPSLDIDESESSQRYLVGLQGFGGLQMTFGGLPLSVSADVGYHTFALGGLSLGGVGMSVSAHWHLR